jgi:rubrerythrin
MKLLTINEIVDYAIKIEQESYRYYRLAEKIIADKPALEVLHLLAEEEKKHIEWLQNLIITKEENRERLKDAVRIDKNSLNSIVPVKRITSTSSKHEILGKALEREKKTKELYQGMHNMATMNEPVRNTFKYLRDQEREHILRLEALINKS